LDVTLEVTPVTPDAKPPTDTKPATDAKPVADAKPAIDAKPPITQLLTTRAEAGSQALADLRRVLVKASSTEPELKPTFDDVMKAFQAVKEAGDQIKPERNPLSNDLVSNSLAQVAIVDYDKPYYLNGPLPWFGSTKVSAELNTDGTLSQGAIEPETKLAEGIAALLPLKEFLTGKFVKTPTPGAAGGGLMEYKLTVEPRGYRYTITADYSSDPCREVKLDAECKVKPLIKKGDNLWVRTPLDSPSAEKKGDGDAITFSGNITLPKTEKKDP
jgi:hypothetical protein